MLRLFVSRDIIWLTVEIVLPFAFKGSSPKGQWTYNRVFPPLVLTCELTSRLKDSSGVLVARSCDSQDHCKHQCKEALSDGTDPYRYLATCPPWRNLPKHPTELEPGAILPLHLHLQQLDTVNAFGSLSSTSHSPDTDCLILESPPL